LKGLCPARPDASCGTAGYSVMVLHATSCIGETSPKILQGCLIGKMSVIIIMKFKFET